MVREDLCSKIDLVFRGNYRRYFFYNVVKNLVVIIELVIYL